MLPVGETIFSIVGENVVSAAINWVTRLWSWTYNVVFPSKISTSKVFGKPKLTSHSPVRTTPVQCRSPTVSSHVTFTILLLFMSLSLYTGETVHREMKQRFSRTKALHTLRHLVTIKSAKRLQKCECANHVQNISDTWTRRQTTALTVHHPGNKRWRVYWVCAKICRCSSPFVTRTMDC